MAVYDKFQVVEEWPEMYWVVVDRLLILSLLMFPKLETQIMIEMIQVGPEDGQYVLTVEGFNDALSTLGDSLENSGNKHNGMKFSAK